MASYYLLLALLMLPLLLFLKFKSKSSSVNPNYKLPPGPWNLPIIGSIHHFIGRGLPHHALLDLSLKYGGLMFLQLGEHPTVVISSREATKEVMKMHDLKFCDRPLTSTLKIFSYDGKDIAFTPYGEYWREMRKICVSELLSTKRVQSFRTIREEEVEGLINRILSISSAGKCVNLREALMRVVNDVTVRALMGSKSTNQELLLQEIQNAAEFTAGFNIANLFPSSNLMKMLSRDMDRAKRFRRHFDQLFENIIRERRKKVENGDVEDLLSVLLRLYDEDSKNNIISMASIKAFIVDVIMGGTETSATVLDWTMAELMKNPRIMKKAQTKIHEQFKGRKNITESDVVNLGFIHQIIKETMRLHAPGPLIPRKCRQTCNILGYDIPNGTTVLVNAWAIGRNSSYWSDAEKFKPERFVDADSNVQSDEDDFKFVPFGGGRRKCPGLLFGVSIIELVIANLLYHFDWELPNGMNADELDMIETFGMTTRRKSPLLLRAIAIPGNDC